MYLILCVSFFGGLIWFVIFRLIVVFGILLNLVVFGDCISIKLFFFLMVCSFFVLFVFMLDRSMLMVWLLSDFFKELKN